MRPDRRLVVWLLAGAALSAASYWAGAALFGPEPEWQEYRKVRANGARVTVGMREADVERLLGSEDEFTLLSNHSGKNSTTSLERKIWYVRTYHSPHYPGTRQPSECLEVSFRDGKVSGVRRVGRAVGF